MNFNAQNVKIAGFPFRVIKIANNSSKKRVSIMGTLFLVWRKGSVRIAEKNIQRMSVDGAYSDGFYPVSAVAARGLLENSR